MRTKTIIFIFAAAFVAVSCTKEYYEPLNPEEEDTILLRLYTDAGDFEEPSTRTGTADETTVGGAPWVLVFTGSGDTASFAEARQAYTANGKSYVSLTRRATSCRLLVIANTPEQFFNESTGVSTNFTQENLTTYLSATARKSFINAVNSLSTTKLTATRHGSVPYAGTSTSTRSAIPMAGVYDVSSITASTTIGTSANNLQLVRAVAKVTVHNTASGFTLNGAAVINAPRNGRLFQSGTTYKGNSGNLTNYLTATTGDGVTGIAAATSNTTTNNPLYIYESGKSDNTSIIIKGTYNSGVYYYRLEFKKGETLEKYDVLRNNHYKFNITKVDRAGYSTMTEAINSPASNIMYTITVSDQQSRDIVDNGVYYLGLTNSEYTIAGSGAFNNVVAFSIFTNATSSMALGTNSIVKTSGTGLTLNTTITSLSSSSTGHARTDVLISMTTSFTTSSTGIITINLGSLKKTVTIKRGTAPSVSGGYYSLGAQYIFGEILSPVSWAKLSSYAKPDGIGANQMYNPAGGIYVLYYNNQATGAADRYVDICLGSKTAESGHTKVRFYQTK